MTFFFLFDCTVALRRFKKITAPGTSLYHQYHPSKVYYMSGMPKSPIAHHNDALSRTKNYQKALILLNKIAYV